MRYNPTTSAYKLETPYEPTVKVNTRKNTAMQKKVGYFMFTRTLLILLFVCVIAGVLLIKNAQVAQSNKNLNDLKRQYNNLVSENKQSEIDINKNIDLKNVETLAITRLNMNRPLKSQIVYVNTHSGDYSEVLAQKNKASQGSFAGIVKAVSGVLTYFN